MGDSPEGAAERLELILALNKFSDRIDGLSRATTSNTSHIQLSGGPWGLWVAVTCCIVSMMINLVLLAAFVNHDRKIDDLNHIISAIYMISPSLKPEKP